MRGAGEERNTWSGALVRRVSAPLGRGAGDEP